MHHNAADAASALVSSSSPSTLAFIDRALSSVQGRASEQRTMDGCECDRRRENREATTRCARNYDFMRVPLN